ncbi:hypothetical protein KR038_003242 [Drosophila bunnanda]|nr:hypothetical protein KR038_003242 [Drosophila bunnanda]
MEEDQIQEGLHYLMGLITNCEPTSITVKRMDRFLVIKLDNVDITFVPRNGDWVFLQCIFDEHGEIVHVIKIFPRSIEYHQLCAVERVCDDFLMLGKDIYVLKEDVPPDVILRSADVVHADLIECEYAEFTKRAIKLTLKKKLDKLETKFKQSPTLDVITQSQLVSVIGKTRHIISEPHKTYQISQTVRNSSNKAMHLKSVTMLKGVVSQLSVVEPSKPVDIPAKGEITLLFKVNTKLMGEDSETFDLDFGNFKMRHGFSILVCESMEEALYAEKHMTEADVKSSNGLSAMQKARFYAKQVWSNSRTVVPGETVGVKRRFVSVRMDTYEARLGYLVPDELRQIYLTTKRQSDLFRAIELQYPFVKEMMNIKNYVQNFTLFLHLEEIENFVLIRSYDRDRAHFHEEGEYLALLVDNLAERRPSLVVGDMVHAFYSWMDHTENNNGRCYEGIIHKVLGNRILLKFNSSFQAKYKGEEYCLKFYFSRFGLRKHHHAISRIIPVMGEDFLFPTELTKREVPQLEVRMEGEDDMYLYDSKLKWFNQSLNQIQKRAVFNILRGELLNMPYVIFGPPGTGKTMTLVEVILQLADTIPRARILVGTPSNSSADLITKSIIKSNVLKEDDFIRLVSYNQIDKELIPPELIKYCATVDIGATGSCENGMLITPTGLKMRCQMVFFKHHRVIISTNSTLGNFMQMDFPAGHFTHVLIDEAGQCSEPETMVPISLLTRDKSQVILAGDTKQLQAIVINRFSCHNEYSKSFLERLLDQPPYKKDLLKFPNSSGYNPHCLTKLLNNYRALPTIMYTYSKLFYDNELIPMVSETDSREIRLLEQVQVVFNPVKDIPKNHGAFFYGIDGRNMQCLDSPSWYNPQEAKEIYLMTVSLYKANINENQIGILTPYAQQVKTLKILFMSTNTVMPKIGSVEQFQGQERDIMLISTVRSSQSLLYSDSQMSLGFLKSSKRMNVAISRARALMIVFGNPQILALDSSWRRYITYCAQNKAIFGCELPEAIVNSFDPELEDG